MSAAFPPPAVTMRYALLAIISVLVINGAPAAQRGSMICLKKDACLSVFLDVVSLKPALPFTFLKLCMDVIAETLGVVLWVPWIRYVCLGLCTLNSVYAHGQCKDNGLFVPCLESTKYFHMSAIGRPTWPLWKFPCTQNLCVLKAFNPGMFFSCWELVAAAASTTEVGRMTEVTLTEKLTSWGGTICLKGH